MKAWTLAVAAGFLFASQAAAAEIDRLADGVATDAPVVIRFDSRGRRSIDGVFEQIAAYASTSPAIERVELATSNRGRRRELGVYPKDGEADEVLNRLTTMTPTSTRVSRNQVFDRRREAQRTRKPPRRPARSADRSGPSAAPH